MIVKEGLSCAYTDQIFLLLYGITIHNLDIGSKATFILYALKIINIKLLSMNQVIIEFFFAIESSQGVS